MFEKSGHIMKWKTTNHQTRLYLITATLLLFNWVGAVFSSGLAYADCTGIKIVSWKATNPVYTSAVVKISNTSEKTKFVYLICKHNDGQWYKIIGDKIKVNANEVVEKEIKTGGTWTSIIDLGISKCE